MAMRENKKTYRVALGGIVSAAAVAIMFMGSIIPFATFASPAIAGFCGLYFCLEFKKSTAFAVYATISALSVLLVPDKEQALLFACFFGFYPILKLIIEKHCSKIIGLIFKFIVFNGCILLAYTVLIRLFRMDVISSELADYSTWMVAIMLVLGNIAFYFYDLLITRFSYMYFVKIKPRLTRGK